MNFFLMCRKMFEANSFRNTLPNDIVSSNSSNDFKILFDSYYTCVNLIVMSRTHRHYAFFVVFNNNNNNCAWALLFSHLVTVCLYFLQVYYSICGDND